MTLSADGEAMVGTRDIATTECREDAIVFRCGSESLVGVVSRPATPSSIGVVIVVGGPQYRVGSHRQFVLLARHLAREGIATLRFDCRGMGDSTGMARTFEDIDDDIAAAIDALRAACPSVQRVALWGLCDGASAALMYLASRRDGRVAALALCNPWVRSGTTLARAEIKRYYAGRLQSREFWAKLLRGDVAFRHAVGGFLRRLVAATKRVAPEEPLATFQERMAAGWRDFEGSMLLILSRRDLTAAEFVEYVRANPAWQSFAARTAVERRDIDADHTFSSREWRGEIERLTAGWLRGSVR